MSFRKIDTTTIKINIYLKNFDIIFLKEFVFIIELISFDKKLKLINQILFNFFEKKLAQNLFFNFFLKAKIYFYSKK